MSATMASPTTALTATPGFTRALAAVRGAEIGLLRAVALDVVATGEGDALDLLGPAAIGVISAVTGAMSVDLQAHASADGRATTFLGRGSRGVAVSAHLSVIAADRRDHLRAAIRLVGTHGSVLVDLLRPHLEVRTAAGISLVPFGIASTDGPRGAALDTLTAIAESARSGRTISTTW